MVLYFYVLYAVDNVLSVMDMMGGFSVLEIIKINIFFRPGRSHVRNWQKLVLSLKNIGSVEENI